VAGPAPPTELLAQGAWGSVEAVVLASGHCPALSFLETECELIREKGKTQPEATAHARMNVLFQHMANYGRLSAKRFKPERDQFMAFSHEVANVQVRFPCFRDGNRWVLTHGFRKPGAKKGRGTWPETEVRRANEIRAEYLRRKATANQGNES
jgi:hypothetical protein